MEILQSCIEPTKYTDDQDSQQMYTYLAIASSLSFRAESTISSFVMPAASSCRRSLSSCTFLNSCCWKVSCNQITIYEIKFTTQMPSNLLIIFQNIQDTDHSSPMTGTLHNNTNHNKTICTFYGMYWSLIYSLLGN